MATVIECCHTCKKTSVPLFLCARCKSVKYCSRDCQRADWSERHKLNCSTDLESSAQIAMKSTRAIFSNRNFVDLVQAFSHFWNADGKGYIHCVITPNITSSNAHDAEHFFDCTLEYREGKVEDLRPETLGMNVLFVLSPDDIFRSTTGMIPQMCVDAYERISKRAKIADLTAKQLKVMISDIDFCTFAIGETLYYL